MENGSSHLAAVFGRIWSRHLFAGAAAAPQKSVLDDCVVNIQKEIGLRRTADRLVDDHTQNFAILQVRSTTNQLTNGLCVSAAGADGQKLRTDDEAFELVVDLVADKAAGRESLQHGGNEGRVVTARSDMQRRIAVLVNRHWIESTKFSYQPVTAV